MGSGTYYDGVFLCTLIFYFFLAAQGGGFKPPKPPPPPDPPLLRVCINTGLRLTQFVTRCLIIDPINLDIPYELNT